MSTNNLFLLLFFCFASKHSQGLDESFSIRERFIPLGQHFQFLCDTFKSVKERDVNITDVEWQYRNGDEIELLSGAKNGRFYHNFTDHTLNGFEIQRIHEGVFECRVTYEYDLSPILHSETTAIQLKVQDCDETIDSNASHTLRNPCKHGKCRLLDSPSGGLHLEKLYCDCIEQYTGLYCDVAIPGTWYREIYFYSPTVGHFFLTALLFLSIRLWRDSIPKERVTFVNDIPDFGKPSDADTFDILYPAARKARQPTPPPPDPQPPRADQEPIVLVAPTTASPQVAQQLIIQEVAKLCREIEPRQRGSKRRNTTEEN